MSRDFRPNTRCLLTIFATLPATTIYDSADYFYQHYGYRKLLYTGQDRFVRLAITNIYRNHDVDGVIKRFARLPQKLDFVIPKCSDSIVFANNSFYSYV